MGISFLRLPHYQLSGIKCHIYVGRPISVVLNINVKDYIHNFLDIVTVPYLQQLVNLIFLQHNSRIISVDRARWTMINGILVGHFGTIMDWYSTPQNEKYLCSGLCSSLLKSLDLTT